MFIECGSVVTITAGKYAGFIALVKSIRIPVVPDLATVIPVIEVRILFAAGDVVLDLLPDELELKASDIESEYQFERLVA